MTDFLFLMTFLDTFFSFSLFRFFGHALVYIALLPFLSLLCSPIPTSLPLPSPLPIALLVDIPTADLALPQPHHTTPTTTTYTDHYAKFWLSPVLAVTHAV